MTDTMQAERDKWRRDFGRLAWDRFGTVASEKDWRAAGLAWDIAQGVAERESAGPTDD